MASHLPDRLAVTRNGRQTTSSESTLYLRLRDGLVISITERRERGLPPRLLVHASDDGSGEALNADCLRPSTAFEHVAAWLKQRGL